MKRLIKHLGAFSFTEIAVLDALRRLTQKTDNKKVLGEVQVTWRGRLGLRSVWLSSSQLLN